MFGKPEYDNVMDAWKCELCGGWYKNIGPHLRYHNISMDEYKEEFGFNRHQSFISKDVQEVKREHTLKNKTYLNVKEGGKPYRFKKGKDERRYFKRRPQTKHKLKVLRNTTKKPKKVPYKYKYIKLKDYEI